jgi:hypothetical protein
VHVSQEGVTGDHHFLLPEDGEGFQWGPGDYAVEIFGTIVGRRGMHRFWRLEVKLSEPVNEAGDCVFFDWQPAQRVYKPRILRREIPIHMLRQMKIGRGVSASDDVG